MKNLISFDYAIKYILKSKTGYDVVEDFISSILTAYNYKSIKIKAPLERESNKEAIPLKSSIADLAVEDDEGNGYIVEIDRSYSSRYLHKACFNTSRLIVDSIPVGGTFFDVRKVFHISLIFEDVDEFDDPVYHGKVVFHRIDEKAEVVQLKDSNNHLYRVNVFPEYFILSIPRFDNVISSNNRLEEWLYFLKNESVNDSIVSPHVRKAYEMLSFLNLTEDERLDYLKYCKTKDKAIDYIDSARALGRKEMQLNIAKGMIEEGIDLEVISKILKLSLDEIKQFDK